MGAEKWVEDSRGKTYLQLLWQQKQTSIFQSTISNPKVVNFLPSLMLINNELTDNCKLTQISPTVEKQNLCII